MDRLLGEVVAVSELKPKQIIWWETDFRVVEAVSDHANDSRLLLFADGSSLTLQADTQVMRGWRYLAARRLDA